MTHTERNAIATMDHHAKLANLPTWSELKAKVDAGNGKTAEPAPLDLTKPVQTRDGRAVRILCTDAQGQFPVVALVTDQEGKEQVVMYTANGRLYLEGFDSNFDLVNVKTEPKPMWEWYANLYPQKLSMLSADPQYTKRTRGASSIGAIKLTLFDDGNVTVEKVEV